MLVIFFPYQKNTILHLNFLIRIWSCWTTYVSSLLSFIFWLDCSVISFILWLDSSIISSIFWLDSSVINIGITKRIERNYVSLQHYFKNYAIKIENRITSSPNKIFASSYMSYIFWLINLTSTCNSKLLGDLIFPYNDIHERLLLKLNVKLSRKNSRSYRRYRL